VTTTTVARIVITVDIETGDGGGKPDVTSQANLLETSGSVYSKRTALTTVAVAIGSNIEDLTELIIQADPSNTVNILIGSATDQSWVMLPSDTFKLPVRNPGVVWAKSASSTANVNVFGRKGV
jgi:hypothetical protein